LILPTADLGERFCDPADVATLFRCGALHRTPHVISGSGKRHVQQWRSKKGSWMDTMESSQEFQLPDQQLL
jgi:hypothetical protein